MLVLCAAMALGGTASAAETSDCPSGAADRATVVCEINAARASAGRASLRQRPSLGEAARSHSADMVARGYFAHESPEGEGPADRAWTFGYTRHAESWRVGEILVWSRGAPLTAARAVEMWLESPSHRRIMLSPRYRDLGAGLAPGTPFGDGGAESATTITVNFGRRR